MHVEVRVAAEAARAEAARTAAREQEFSLMTRAMALLGGGSADDLSTQADGTAATTATAQAAPPSSVVFAPPAYPFASYDKQRYGGEGAVAVVSEEVLAADADAGEGGVVAIQSEVAEMVLLHG